MTLETGVCCFIYMSRVRERTTGDVAERQEAIHGVTQKVEVSQQVGAVASSFGKHSSALSVRRAQLGITDVPDVCEEVEDVPQSASCRGQRSDVERWITTI